MDYSKKPTSKSPKKALFWAEKDSMVDKLCASPDVAKIRFDAIEGNLPDDQLKAFHKADKEMVKATAEIIHRCYGLSRERADEEADTLMNAAVNGRQGIVEDGKSHPVETFGDAVKFINDHLPYL